MLLAASLVACFPSREPYTIHAIGAGQLVTPGAEIVAEDGSFRLTAGATFTPPFQQLGDCLLDPTAENYREAIGAGAKPVRIRLGDGRELYGLLSLCGAPAGASGPATRSYAVEIPDRYVAETAGGRVSVVFESFTSTPVRAKAWILWLSERSFRTEPGKPGGATVDREVDNVFRPLRTMRIVGIVTTLGGIVLGAVEVSRLRSRSTELLPDMPLMVVGGSALIVGPLFLFMPAQTGKLALHEHLNANRSLATASHELRATMFGISGRF